MILTQYRYWALLVPKISMLLSGGQSVLLGRRLLLISMKEKALQVKSAKDLFLFSVILRYRKYF
ncbi:hypothetical protein C5L43_05725 [Ectopseudomonas oleovorans]|nr:hypothetical protein C5L43_05725 [Pseudomonas oleovorans]